jgi:hypothetical protein
MSSTLQTERAKLWHADEPHLATIEETRDWLEVTGLCTLLPVKTPPAPSLAGAVEGGEKSARNLLARLAAEGAVFVLPPQPGEKNLLVASAALLPALYVLRETQGRHRTPLVEHVLGELGRGEGTAAELAVRLRNDVTETAVLRALDELWFQLEVLPLPGEDAAEPMRWHLTQDLFGAQMNKAKRLSQPLALSTLLSHYLEAVIAAEPAEVEEWLIAFATRARVRDALNALVTARQLEHVTYERQQLLKIAGETPEWLAVEPAPLPMERPAGPRPSYVARRPAAAGERPAMRKRFERPDGERGGERKFERREGGEKKFGEKKFGDKTFERREGGAGFPRRKPAERSFGRDAERGAADSRPPRKFGPPRDGEKRTFGAKKFGPPRDGEKRAFGAKKFGPPRGAGDSRPPRKFGPPRDGEKRAFGPKKFGPPRDGEKRTFGAKKFGPPRGAGDSRPPRKFGPPRDGEKRTFGAKKFGPPRGAGAGRPDRKPYPRRDAGASEGAAAGGEARRPWKDRPAPRSASGETSRPPFKRAGGGSKPPFKRSGAGGFKGGKPGAGGFKRSGGGFKGKPGAGGFKRPFKRREEGGKPPSEDAK